MTTQYKIPEIDIDCLNFTKENDSFNQYPRHVYYFSNGYGASVIHNPYSHGIELAVIKKVDDGWCLTYDTPITDDVVGYISGKEELQNWLEKIKDLKQGENK